MTNPVQTPFLSIVIPAFNESTNIKAGSLQKVLDYFTARSYDYEVLVVDDGSADETALLAQAFADRHASFRLICNAHHGKAYAIAAGISSAKGEIVLCSDMDQAAPIGEVEKLLPWFSQGYDVVIGSRGWTRPHAPLWRKVMSYCQIILRSILFGFQGITDTQCGFKAFRRETARTILSRLRLYAPKANGQITGASVNSGFDVEMLFVAYKLGYRIREVSVQWDYRYTRRVNLLKDAIPGLYDLIMIRLADLRGAYRVNIR